MLKQQILRSSGLFFGIFTILGMSHFLWGANGDGVSGMSSHVLNRLAVEKKKASVSAPSYPFSPGVLHGFVQPLARSSGLRLKFSKLYSGMKTEKPLATVFVQRPYVWIMLDHPVTSHFDDHPNFKIPEGFGKPEFIQSGKTTVIRMKIPFSIEPSIEYDPDKGWCVILGNDSLHPAGSYPFLTSRLFASLASPPSLIIKMENSRPVGVEDPDSGESWVLMPTQEVGLGLPGVFRYADFSFMKSLQGFVLKPQVPGLVFQKGKSQIVLSRTGGINFSSAQDRKDGKQSEDALQFFNFKAWQHQDLSFSQAKSHLENAISSASETERLRAKLNLVQFLISYGNGAEALGVLRVIAFQNHRLKEDVEFMALIGLASFLNQDYAKALRILSNPNLPEEIELWKGALLVSLGLSQNGLLLMEKQFSLLKNYPDPLKSILALKAIDASLHQKNAKEVEKFFDLVKHSKLTSSQENQLRNYQRDFLALVNPSEVENPLFNRHLKGKAAQKDAEEEFFSIKKGYADKTFSLKDTIEKMESLRLSWRGDFIEFLALQELGGLYAVDQDFQNSLESYDRAVRFFPHYSEIDTLKKNASQVFKKGLAVLKPAFRKIAFYYRFQKFLPTDLSAIDILDKLSKQLIVLDLPDQAVTILEKEVHKYHQINPQLFVSLAQAYLADNQPDKALNTLDSRNIFSGSPALKDRANYIRAASFYKKHDYMKALGYTENKYDVEALDLRSKIYYWDLGQWDNVAYNISAMIDQLKKTPPEMILRLSMALYQGKRTKELGILRQRYGHLMKNSGYGDVFAILTQTDPRRMTNQAMEKALREVKAFEAFSSVLKLGKI